MICGRELVDLTPASYATLRRDLGKVEEMGQIQRVQGGFEDVEALQQTNLSARSFGVSQTLNVERERSFAEAAVPCREAGRAGGFINIRSGVQHCRLQAVTSPHATLITEVSAPPQFLTHARLEEGRSDYRRP